MILKTFCLNIFKISQNTFIPDYIYINQSKILNLFIRQQVVKTKKMKNLVFSQKNDGSMAQTLTKFNLTNYKSSHIGFKIRSKKKLEFLQLSQQQSSERKFKHQEPIQIHVNKIRNDFPSFGTLDIQNLIRKNKKRAKSQMKIQVTSRSEKSLIEFMNPQNLPTISIKNRLKKSPVQKLVAVVNNQEKFRKFTQTYFRSLQKTKKKLQGNQVRHQFQVIKVLGWTVKGYLIRENLILKASKEDKKGKNSFQRKTIEKYKKILYNDEVQEKVRNDYVTVVKNWLYLDEILHK